MGIVPVRAASLWMRAPCSSWGGGEVPLESHQGQLMVSPFPSPALCQGCTGGVEPFGHQALGTALVGWESPRWGYSIWIGFCTQMLFRARPSEGDKSILNSLLLPSPCQAGAAVDGLLTAACWRLFAARKDNMLIAESGLITHSTCH